MDAHFYQSETLPKATLHTLMQRSHRPALGHFIIMYSGMLLSGAGMVMSWGQAWGWFGISLAVFATLGCSQFAALHETVHGTAFGTKGANRLAARLAGLAHIYPSAIFRELHFMHHRHTHVPGLDPEISLGSRPIASVISNLPLYMSWLSGLPLLLFKLGFTLMGALGMPEPVRKGMYPYIQPKARGQVFLESWLVLLVWGGITVLAITVTPAFWCLWLGQGLAHMILAGYLTPEHNGLPNEGDILHRTRSMRASRGLRWLMWNMPYHAEHHAYPAVPFHALPQLHEALKDDLVHKEQYPHFHRKTFRRLVSGKP